MIALLTRVLRDDSVWRKGLGKEERGNGGGVKVSLVPRPFPPPFVDDLQYICKRE